MANTLKIKDDEMNVMEFLAKCDTELARVEVKGDSVEHLHIARLVLRQVLSNIEREEDKDA